MADKHEISGVIIDESATGVSTQDRESKANSFESMRTAINNGANIGEKRGLAGLQDAGVALSNTSLNPTKEHESAFALAYGKAV